MLSKYNQAKIEMINTLKNLNLSDKRCYADYLAQTYYYVNHSERLLALAAARMSNEDRKLQRRFFTHLSEENAHDLMVKKDLQNLGFTLADFPERSETKMFWETQYYKIEHQDPTFLLGYILLLEDVAANICTWMFKEVEKKYGAKCGVFLRVHGEEDPEHVAEAFKAITTLSEERQVMIYQNLFQSQVAFCRMISAINEGSINRSLLSAV